MPATELLDRSVAAADLFGAAAARRLGEAETPDALADELERLVAGRLRRADPLARAQGWDDIDCWVVEARLPPSPSTL